MCVWGGSLIAMCDPIFRCDDESYMAVVATTTMHGGRLVRVVLRGSGAGGLPHGQEIFQYPAPVMVVA